MIILQEVFNCIECPLKERCVRQKDNPEMIRVEPVKPRALDYEHTFLFQKVEGESLVVFYAVHFRIDSGEEIKSALRFCA